MIEIRQKLKVPHALCGVEVEGTLKLPFELRQKSRLRTQLVSGEEVGLLLARGEVLRGGELLIASDGRVIEVIAEPEKVLHITCKTPQQLARAAYHLGNRHVPLQVEEDFLRIAADHVLEEMLRGLGAATLALEAPFEPEAGAYGSGHQNDDDGSRIRHTGHEHDHGHDHGNHRHRHK